MAQPGSVGQFVSDAANPFELLNEIGRLGGIPPDPERLETVKAQERKGIPAFPGGVRSIGKPDDWENVWGQRFRGAGDISSGLVEGSWEWLKSMFDDVDLTPGNTDPHGRPLY